MTCSILRGGVSLLGAALLVSACDDQAGPLDVGQAAEAPDSMMFEDTGKRAIPELAAGPVATIRLANGGSVDFIDVGDGEIAIGEKVVGNGRFIARPLMLESNATPLEVFEALRTDAAPAPQTLVADHARRAAAGQNAAAPRQLSVELGAPQGLDDPGIEPYACDSFGSEWISDWKATFTGVTDYYPAEYKHVYQGQWTFYPGGHIYYGTNANSITYLGACNGDNGVTMPVNIERRVKHTRFNHYPEPPTVWFEWHVIAQIELEGYEKYTFHSNLPAYYRGVLLDIGQIIHHLGLGAAYTKAPGFGLEL